MTDTPYPDDCLVLQKREDGGIYALNDPEEFDITTVLLLDAIESGLIKIFDDVITMFFADEVRHYLILWEDEGSNPWGDPWGVGPGTVLTRPAHVHVQRIREDEGS